MTENSVAWEKVFDRLNFRNVLEAVGLCYVTADELKAHGGREPRLMAKLDTLQDRPAIFVEHEVNILPVRNGRYIIFKDPANKTYFEFGDALDHIPIQKYVSASPLSHFDTFPGGKQFSESQAIDFAFVASLLRTFCGDPSMQLTIRGRLFSDQFVFQAPANNHEIEVNRVQIEVDSGYEGQDRIFLIEAKVGRRKDFNIRQLYYPFLNWSARSRKKIIPIFLTFTNGQFFFTEFALTKTFGELTIVRSEGYTINDSPFAEIAWADLFQEVTCEGEDSFPQADDLDKVVDLVRLAGSGMRSKVEFAEFFEFDERQGDYYANAAKYLGLLARAGQGFHLTELGTAFGQLPARADRTLWLARQMLKRPSFRQIIELLRARNYHLASLTTTEVAGIIQAKTGLNETTARRRAITARSWVAWLMKNSRPV